MKKQRLKIGLTGGIGSGKTTVANYFAKFGVELTDADLIAREVVAKNTPGLEKITQHFGREILLEDGELDRAALRAIVFEKPQERIWLEQLTHPLISRLIQQRLEDSTSPYSMLVSPLLFETTQHSFVDRSLVIDVSEETQLRRTLDRDGSSEATIKGIIAAQINRQERLQKADDIINNEASLAAVAQQVEHLHEKYLALAKQFTQ